MAEIQLFSLGILAVIISVLKGFRKMIKYKHKENYILCFADICEIIFFWTVAQPLTHTGFIYDIEFRDVPFATLGRY